MQDDPETAAARKRLREELSLPENQSGKRRMSGVTIVFSIICMLLPVFVLFFVMMKSKGFTDMGQFFEWFYNCMTGRCT